MPVQRRLEFTRRRVPDFDGFVPAAAGNLFAVWTETNAFDAVAAQKHQISTNLQKKAFYTRGWDVPVPGQRRLALKRASRL